MDEVLEFDDLKNTLGNWCISEQETIDQLPLLEVTEEKLQLQQQECHTLLEGITAQDSPLERLQGIADQFLRDTEVRMYGREGEEEEGRGEKGRKGGGERKGGEEGRGGEEGGRKGGTHCFALCTHSLCRALQIAMLARSSPKFVTPVRMTIRNLHWESRQA